MRYRIVEARQITPQTLGEIAEWIGDGCEVVGQHLEIGYLDGRLVAWEGDWVVRQEVGGASLFYPVSNAEFISSFESVRQIDS